MEEKTSAIKFIKELKRKQNKAYLKQLAINEKDGSILKNLGKQGIFGNSLSLVAPIINKKNILLPI